MESIADRLMLLLILSDLALLGTRPLRRVILTAGLQGVLIGALALASHPGALTARAVWLAALGLGMRGLLFPWLLRVVARRTDAESLDQRLQPYVGYGTSLLVGIAMLAGAMALGARMPLPASSLSGLVVPAALFTMFTGLFLVIARRKALRQCLGYVVLENGIYAFGVAAVGEVPALVELGALLDLFLAVLVMGVAIYRITEEFDHMDTEKLDLLRG
jgi:hydrogenase-4 component E